MQGRRPGYREIFFVTVGQACIPDDIACAGLSFEIIEGLYGKENAVHSEQQRVE